MSEAVDPAPEPRRFFIAAATARYDDLPEHQWLPSVTGDVQRLTEVLCGRLGYQRVLCELSADPTSQQLRTRLSEFLTDGDRRSDDIVVFYYSGHGVIQGGRHYLLTRDSQDRNPAGTALATEELAWMIGAASPVQHLLLIIDTCYAGRGTQDLGRVTAQFADLRTAAGAAGSGLWFLAAARPREEADEGALAAALATALLQPRTGFTQEYLSLDSLTSEINTALQRHGWSQRATLGATDAAGVAPFFPNLSYVAHAPPGLEVDRLYRLHSVHEQDFAAHWIPRSRGVALAEDPGWYFTGRSTVLRELTNWLGEPDADHYARVVTGGPGSGKSAVLARLVTLAVPAIRQQAVLASSAPDTLVSPGMIDVAIHARNKTVADLVAELADRCGVQAHTAGELADALVADPRRRVIVIDAVDEATEADAVAGQLTRTLLEHAAAAQVRLLIGTRRPLIDKLGSRVCVLDLDDPAYLDEHDVAEYVAQVLLAEREPQVVTPYRGRLDAAYRVARAVARRAGPTFLIARIVARWLVSEPDIHDVTTNGWQERLPSTVGNAFRGYLERFGADEQRVRDLLTPLAWSQGAGLPWEQIWAPAAVALASGCNSYGDADIAWLLEHAGAYIVENLEHGRSVYRLYHEALAEHLRRDAVRADVQRRLTEALVSTVPATADGAPDWFVAHPYIRTHLATHAADGGELSRLLQPAFLLAAESDRLLSALTQVTGAGDASAAAIYERAAHLMTGRPAREAAAILRVVALQQGNTVLADQIDILGLALPYRAAWAQWRPQTRHLVLGTARAGIEGIVCLRQQDRTVAITGDFGGSRGELRLWDLDANQRWRILAEVHPRPAGDNRVGPCGVRALLTGSIDNETVVVSGGNEGLVYTWDPATGEQRTGPIRPGRTASALAVIATEPTSILLTSEVAGAVGVRDLQTGRLMTTSMPGGEFTFITALAVGEVQNRRVVVAGGYGLPVRAWDVDSQRLLWQASPPPPKTPEPAGPRWLKPFRSNGKRDHGAAFRAKPTSLTVGDGGACQVAAAGYGSGPIHIWNLADGRRLDTTPVDHGDDVMCLAMGNVNRRPTLISGAFDGTLRMWDLPTGQPRSPALTGHSGPVTALTVTVLNERTVLVSGGADGTLRVWDLAVLDAGAAAGQGALPRKVRAVVSDGQVIVGIDGDGQLQQWDAADGRPLGTPLRYEQEQARAIAVATVDGRRVAVAGTTKGAVQVWDLHTGTLITRARKHLGHVDVVAISSVAGHPVGVSVESSSSDGRVLVWDLLTGRPRTGFTRRGGSKTALSVAVVDGVTVAVVGNLDTGLAIWDLGTGYRLAPESTSMMRLWQRIRPVRRRPWPTNVWSWYRAQATHLAFVSVGEQQLLVAWYADHLLQVIALDGAGPLMEESTDYSVTALAAGLVDGIPMSVLADTAGTLHLWDLQACRELPDREVPLLTPATGLALDDRGRCTVASDRGLVMIDFAPASARTGTRRGNNGLLR